LEAPLSLVSDQAFNVGQNEENYQIRDLGEIVREVVPGSGIEYAPNGGPDKRCYRVDCSKIRRLPGFKPQWTVRRGAHELFEAYARAGLRREDVAGTRFRRLDHIQRMIIEGRMNQQLRFVQEFVERAGTK